MVKSLPNNNTNLFGKGLMEERKSTKGLPWSSRRWNTVLVQEHKST